MVSIVNTNYLIPEVKLFKLNRFNDNRGFFAETFNKEVYSKFGINSEFVQDNHSFSLKAGTVRGLHFKEPPHDQSKLVHCGKGMIFDVAVDLRKDSPTYGKWIGQELSYQNGYQLYIPSGFAHGFITLESCSEIIYKCTNYYSPESERSVLWNDPDIGIKWPSTINKILNERDAKAPPLKNIKSSFSRKLKS